jgi:hypothetical protein
LSVTLNVFLAILTPSTLSMRHIKFTFTNSGKQ